MTKLTQVVSLTNDVINSGIYASILTLHIISWMVMTIARNPYLPYNIPLMMERPLAED